ncbi:MAG: hypothetical protein F6K63_17755 [Moorea sp. SIO1G6]|uniref:2-oxoglutarate and iron-dependent oxygenase domain-containing protein n=1 Tax=Moorena sp. SIO1G6 TaxID=2607840 RepID=UPI0013C1385F|nr:2-oxoglutarate and iron-dependent oxygenase domain-containing protein [Moorena sp. SIO1G6]NES85535.1 hypothetical protein [Moorena sp. SIO2B7]NET66130.1 hypothetical protein [Moorena sp. SIO1G6]
MENLPIIYLKKLGQGELHEIERLYLACDHRGFLYLNDYGIAKEVIEYTIAASRQFVNAIEVMLKDYQSIWKTNEGAGRAKEIS